MPELSRLRAWNADGTRQQSSDSPRIFDVLELAWGTDPEPVFKAAEPFSPSPQLRPDTYAQSARAGWIQVVCRPDTV